MTCSNPALHCGRQGDHLALHCGRQGDINYLPAAYGGFHDVRILLCGAGIKWAVHCSRESGALELSRKLGKVVKMRSQATLNCEPHAACLSSKSVPVLLTGLSKAWYIRPVYWILYMKHLFITDFPRIYPQFRRQRLYLDWRTFVWYSLEENVTTLMAALDSEWVIFIHTAMFTLTIMFL